MVFMRIKRNNEKEGKKRDKKKKDEMREGKNIEKKKEKEERKEEKRIGKDFINWEKEVYEKVRGEMRKMLI